MPSELFETFDRTGQPTGLVARNEVHARGLWHKSAHVFLFDAEGHLFIQRRAADKDLYADLWDYSVGEHLTPGETYLAGAIRGLEEELGVSGVALRQVGDANAHGVQLPGGGTDNEFQLAFTGEFHGEIRPDPVEVAEVRTIALESLRVWLERAPEQFTPWFLRDVFRLGFLEPL